MTITVKKIGDKYKVYQHDKGSPNGLMDTFNNWEEAMDFAKALMAPEGWNIPKNPKK